MSRDDYSIKGLRSWNTDDGGGYECKLYLGNKKVADCLHDGTGDEVGIRFADSDEAQAFDRFIKDQPKRLYPANLGGGEYTVNADIFIGDLVNEEQNRRVLKRYCAKKTLFRLEGDDPDEGWRTLSIPYDPRAQAYLDKKYPDRVKEIANKRFLESTPM